MVKIAVDLDGVIAAFTDRAKPIVERVTGKRLPDHYEPCDWDWSDVISASGWTAVWAIIRATPGFWLGIQPFENNVRALRRFLQSRPDVLAYYCTSRIKTGGQPVKQQCEMWLEDQKLLPRCGDEVIISGAINKADIYRELDVIYSIDDKPETVNDCLEIRGHYPYLLDRCYNRNWQLPRVYGMAEFLGIVSATEVSGKRTSVGGAIA